MDLPVLFDPMVNILFFVNSLRSTSIPVEIAGKINDISDENLILASYYDGPEDDLDSDVGNLEIPTIMFDATSRADISAYRKLREVCIERDIHLLHTHHNSTGSLGRLAAVGTDTKVVNTEHNDHRFFSTLQRISNSVTFPLIDRFVSNSYATEKSLNWYERGLLYGTPREVVYNGINTARMDAVEAPDVDLPKGPIVTTVGVLTEQKNHRTLLQSFRQVVQNVPEASLVIVGDGSLSEELKDLVTNLDISESVVFTGYLPRREHVYSVLLDSTVAVFPSWYEGFCVAAVEAMAAGLPVVVSDIEVLHEVVGDPGVFVDPGDPDAIAEATIDLLEHPDKRADLATRAKERARSTFSLERTAEEYCKIYTDLAETSYR
jgi:glycosyltransferase involved in cell wall biosynthesis